ncbi:MAG: nucleotide exchange factor GrpE [Gammaproteobacteria bacterium]|nr:nucleotide exchange factor GrpE [Gammaproteobacteria bacterium]NBT44645.1 nucleotide exchange factor GrpE [Gammaproteobacteria bacterium]NBY23826.1 nucleotide exchange factor GrpE [Gammaproteobacteria bacterium]
MSHDDVMPEDGEAPAAATPDLETTLETRTPEEWAEALANAEQKAQENWDKVLRTQADLENIKRRSEKDLQNAHKFGIEKFARELLPVADSLELGLSVETAGSPEVQKLREGMELTLKQLLSSLEKFNVVQVNPEGEKFNPEWHQAMAMQPTDEAEPNTVLKVYQKGYLLSDRLLRPAMVVVAQDIGSSGAS